MERKRLEQLLSKFSSQRVLVIGDVILDRYLWCEVERISPEAPVPVASVATESTTLGGAGNVALNIVSLGSQASLFGVIGADANGKQLARLLRKNRIRHTRLVTEKMRPTTTKTRVMCDSHQLLRVDHEIVSTIFKENETRLLEQVDRELNKGGVVIISDYAKGLVSENLARKVIELSRLRRALVLVDPKPPEVSKFKGAYLIKPNKKEAELISGKKFREDYSNLEKIGSLLEKLLQSRFLVTLGADGLALFDERHIIRIPTLAQEVFDVSGAGDTSMAALAVALASGATLEEAAIVGNLAAGVVVGKVGTSSCTQDELLKQYDKYEQEKDRISRSRRNDHSRHRVPKETF